MVYPNFNFIFLACFFLSPSRLISTVLASDIISECEAEEFWASTKDASSKKASCIVEGGASDIASSPMFAARARHDNGWVAGEYHPPSRGTFIGWNSKVHLKPIFQVAYSCNVRWESSTQGLLFPARALTAGRSPDGRLIYPCRHLHGNQINIGRIFAEEKICYIPYGTNEIAFVEYEVLVVERGHRRCIN